MKLTSKNREWGFYGTTVSNYGFDTETMELIFHRTALILAGAKNLDLKEAVEVLDSKEGRHLSDSLSYLFPYPTVSDQDLIHALLRHLSREVSQ